MSLEEYQKKGSQKGSCYPVVVNRYCSRGIRKGTRTLGARVCGFVCWPKKLAGACSVDICSLLSSLLPRYLLKPPLLSPLALDTRSFLSIPF